MVFFLRPVTSVLLQQNDRQRSAAPFAHYSFTSSPPLQIFHLRWLFVEHSSNSSPLCVVRRAYDGNKADTHNPYCLYYRLTGIITLTLTFCPKLPSKSRLYKIINLHRCWLDGETKFNTANSFLFPLSFHLFSTTAMPLLPPWLVHSTRFGLHVHLYSTCLWQWAKSQLGMRII